MNAELRAEYSRLWRRRQELLDRRSRLEALLHGISARLLPDDWLIRQYAALDDELAENTRLMDAVQVELGGRFLGEVAP